MIYANYIIIIIYIIITSTHIYMCRYIHMYIYRDTSLKNLGFLLQNPDN